MPEPSSYHQNLPIPIMAKRRQRETESALLQPWTPRPEDAWYAKPIERAYRQLQPYCGSDLQLSDWLYYLARCAYAAGRDRVMFDIRTSGEVAEEMGIHRTTVFRWARDLGIGWQAGRDLLFLPDDVERLRKFKRPRRAG